MTLQKYDVHVSVYMVQIGLIDNKTYVMPPKRGSEIQIFLTDSVDLIAMIFLSHLTFLKNHFN